MSYLVLLLSVVVSLLGAAPAAMADDGGTLGVDMVVNSNGTESRDISVKGGATKLFIIKYSCSSSACQNVKVTLPIASGVDFSGELYGGEWTQHRTGSEVSWTADSLPAGTTSQITFNLTVPNGVLADGTVLSHQASITADGSTSESSTPVTMTVRSGGSTRVDLSQQAGGAVDAWTTYFVHACLEQPSDPDFGQLGVQSGSVLTLHLPSGAVVKESDGATQSAHELTWTFGQLTGAGCAGRVVKMEFPSSDSDNGVGSDQVLTADWDGAMQGESQKSLGTDSHTTTLAAQTSDSGNAVTSWISTDRVYVGDSIGQGYHAGNSGTGVLDSVRADTDISVDQKVTQIWAHAWREPGELWISVDGGPLTKIADVDPHHDVVVDPYASTLPDGSPGLTSGQYVTNVRFLTGGFQPADDHDILYVTSKVLDTTTDGTEVHAGDTFTVHGQQTVADSVGGGPYTRPANHTYEIVERPAPRTAITVRAGGGATVANGGSRDINWTGYISGADATDPVMTMRLDKQLRMNSWHMTNNSANLPQPTLTKIADKPSTGQTLVRFTWPHGTVLPKDNYVTMELNVTYGDKAFGNAQFKGFVSSAGTYDCGDPWFLEGPDSDDLDGDGTTHTLCAWADQLSPTTSVGAQLVQSIKGAWDDDFKAGPATSYSSPGSADKLRAELQNTGNIFLSNATVVTKLPRPGDSRILGSTQRNPSSSTFPMILSGRPAVPSLDTAVKTYWTTETNPCLPEVGASVAGCSTPTWTDWDDVAPGQVKDVTALKFDFGSNQLTPFSSWAVNIPVTTPTSGATEPDFAVSNPVRTDSANDEKAVATSAAVVTRTDISSQLNAIESTPVTLAMPGSGGPYTPPAPEDMTSSGTYPDPQSVTITKPTGGAVRLLDADHHVVSSNELVVPGEGTYVLNPTTGKITFTPASGFVGPATPVGYRVVDSENGSGDATYAPEVLAPAAPAPVDQTPQGTGTTVQSATFTKPSGGSVALVDPLTHTPISSHQVVVPGVGTYVLNPATGKVSFTPELGYAGTPEGVTVAVTDSVGQTGYATFVPTVQAPAAPVTPTRSGTATKGHPVSVPITLPPGGQLRLWNGAAAVTSIVVPHQGTYSVDEAAGALVFTPEAGFTGDPAPVSYQVGDAYGQVSRGAFEPHVLGEAVPGSARPTTADGRRGKPTTLSPLAHVKPPSDQTLVPSSLRVASRADGPGVTRLRKAAGTWVTHRDGTVTFQPARRFVGVATAYFAVRTSDGQWLRSTMSVVVRGVVTGHRSATVYFGVRSSHLSHHGRAVLRHLAARVPARATSRAVSIGYVQPEHYRGNDRRLSRARARAVAQTLTRLIDLGRVTVSGRGRAHEHGWRARRATATVYWRLVQH